jgi:hypothetical protein
MLNDLRSLVSWFPKEHRLRCDVFGIRATFAWDLDSLPLPHVHFGREEGERWFCCDLSAELRNPVMSLHIQQKGAEPDA